MTKSKASFKLWYQFYYFIGIDRIKQNWQSMLVFLCALWFFTWISGQSDCSVCEREREREMFFVWAIKQKAQILKWITFNLIFQALHCGDNEMWINPYNYVKRGKMIRTAIRFEAQLKSVYSKTNKPQISTCNKIEYVHKCCACHFSSLDLLLIKSSSDA